LSEGKEKKTSDDIKNESESFKFQITQIETLHPYCIATSPQIEATA
jgi:hypothetical protein